MAELKNGHLDLVLTYTSSATEARRNNEMPRLDVCRNCGDLKSMHVDNKCMFSASNFLAVDMDYTQFHGRFMAWLSGQKIEDAFINIVYELTRRNR